MALDQQQGQGISGPTGVVALLAAFQLLMWFNPSEPYFTDHVAHRFNLSVPEIVNDVFAWDLLLQLGAAAGLGLVFLACDHRAALLLCALAGAASAAAVLWGSTFAVLIASQGLWALFFTSLFAVLATCFLVVPRDRLQLASSANSAAMLTASLLSSLVGFAITKSHSANTRSKTFTFAMNLGANILAIALLLAMIVSGKLNLRIAQIRDPAGPAGARASLLAVLRSQVSGFFSKPTPLGWILAGAVMRGVHTEVLTLWQSLCQQIVHGDEAKLSNNGLISFFMYLVAAFAVFIPAAYPSRFARIRFLLPAGAFFVCGLALLGASYSKCQATLALSLVVFHTAAELFMSVASVQLVSEMAGARQPRNQSCSDEAASLDQLTTTAGAHDSGGSGSSLYLTAAALTYVLSLVVEALIQLVIWPHWGSVHNIFHLSLSLAEQFRGFAIVLLACCTASFLFTVHLYRVAKHVRENDVSRPLLGPDPHFPSSNSNQN